MSWAYKILLLQLGITMGLALVLYIIWRLTHPGQKW